MQKKKLSIFLVLMLTVSAILAACGGGSSNSSDSGQTSDNGGGENNVLNLTETQDIPSMDSSLATDVVSFDTLNSVMEGLYRLGEDDEAVEGMAEGEPQISEDGKTWTIKLRDANWSNGEPVTANDFVFAWRKTLNPDTAAEYAYIMYDLKNAAAVNAGEMAPEELGVKALDEKTLEIQLENPVPYFKELLTFATFYPQNEAYVTEQGDQFGLEANTVLYNGPFTMTEWKHEDQFVLQKNPEYWDAENVQLETVNTKIVKDTQTDVNLYESGELDSVKLSAEFVDKYKEEEGFHTVKEASVFFLRLNQSSNEVLKNADARKAIAMGFDKTGITDSLLNNGSVPANYLVPSEFVQGPDGKDFRETAGSYLETDQAVAAEHWAKAKEALGQDTVELELLSYDDDVSKKITEYLKEQLETNLEGLKVNIKLQPFKQKLDLESSMNYEASLAGWGPDYPDPMTFIDMFVTDGAHNQSGYSNPQVDKLVQDAKTTLLTDEQARWDALVEAEKLMLEDAAFAPVYQRARAYLTKPAVEGVLYHKFGANFSLKWTSVTR
ncbi:peptide ABC transporter substrate-binding protein [Domibacillus tundrae]|uniref:peptide ABC transporter substrate-binding protein n=1 Tax=Domibacillus tundrae TaxID=1587527 RepID=UPI000617CCD6|nr:peptide ABC transporter substrate-binding protein [Domibacillus tundrae]